MSKETKARRTREIIAGLSLIAAYGVLGSLFTKDKGAIFGLEFMSGLAVILALWLIVKGLRSSQDRFRTAGDKA